MDTPCTCGHAEDEHFANGTCSIEECLCAGFEEDDDGEPAVR